MRSVIDGEKDRISDLRICSHPLNLILMIDETISILVIKASALIRRRSSNIAMEMWYGISASITIVCKILDWSPVDISRREHFPRGLSPGKRASILYPKSCGAA